MPFYAARAAAIALTVILWILAARGVRELYVRYRPTEAVLTQ